MSSSPRPPRASCPPTCRASASIPNASSSAIRSTRSICCRWSKPCPARRPRKTPWCGPANISKSIGMQVLRLKREIMGYVCDRLQEALWREALHILNKDIATTGDIDDSIVYSAGMRWAFMGSFLTYHVAGGPGGMRDFIKQFDPTLELDWTDLEIPQVECGAGKAPGRRLRGASRGPQGLRDRSQAQRHSGRHDEAVQETQDRRRACARPGDEVRPRPQGRGQGPPPKRDGKVRELGMTHRPSPPHCCAMGPFLSRMRERTNRRSHAPTRHDHRRRRRHRPAIAKAFAADGARVHICDVNEAALGAIPRGVSRYRAQPM